MDFEAKGDGVWITRRGPGETYDDIRDSWFDGPTNSSFEFRRVNMTMKGPVNKFLIEEGSIITYKLSLLELILVERILGNDR